MEQARATGPEVADELPTARRLEELFAHSQSELLGTLYHLLDNADDARDALQDAFIKCWRHRAEAAAVDNLRAWVFRIVLNTGRDLRDTAWRRRRRSLDDRPDDAPAAPSPAVEVEHREEVGRVQAAVKRLRQEEQDVFLLRQNGELTYEEIGEMLKIPTSTVKTRMRLALDKLRQALEA